MALDTLTPSKYVATLFYLATLSAETGSPLVAAGYYMELVEFTNGREGYEQTNLVARRSFDRITERP